jgi:hypothetical protein
MLMGLGGIGLWWATRIFQRVPGVTKLTDVLGAGPWISLTVPWVSVKPATTKAVGARKVNLSKLSVIVGPVATKNVTSVA